MQPNLRAPANSEESEDNYNLDYSTEEEKKDVMEDKPQEKVFNESLVDMCPFDLDKMNVFPHKYRDGEPPLKLLLEPEEQYMVEKRE